MRILIIEDEPSLGEAISAHLKLNGYASDTAPSLAAAELALRVGGFDTILLDLMLPDGDGITFLSKLRQQQIRTPVIIMTARDQISDRVKGLSMGADDYLVKPFDLNEMVARIQAVLRRYEGNPSPFVQVGNLEVDKSGKRVRLDGIDAQLTAKEWAVFEKLHARKGGLVAKEQLQEALYSFDDEVGSNTVEVYISHLRKKLGRHRIETARGLGYKLVMEGAP